MDLVPLYLILNLDQVPLDLNQVPQEHSAMLHQRRLGCTALALAVWSLDLVSLYLNLNLYLVALDLDLNLDDTRM